MCLILLAHRAHPELPLVVAANRDEFYGRPTARAAFWDDAPEVLAGRDLERGGTWMGVTRDGRWAAVTNVREPEPGRKPDAPSRGWLVGDYLRGELPAAEYLRRVAEQGDEFEGFNLLAGDGTGVFYLSNREGRLHELPPGVYGLSNDRLDTPWPKVERGKRALRACLDASELPSPAALLRVLADSEPAPDAALPDTGVGTELERVLSSLFIRSAEYGTRASTVLLRDGDGGIRFVERVFEAGVAAGDDASFTFDTAR